MSVQLLRTTAARIYQDHMSRYVSAGVFCFSAVVYLIFGTVAGLVIPLFYISGLVLASVSLNNKQRISRWIQSAKDFYGYRDCVRSTEHECSACGVLQCQRHIVDKDERTLWLDEELDKAVAGFYSVILENFIRSWFSTFSDDETFVHMIRVCLRDATCRLGVSLQSLEMPKLITERLLPVVFAHSEVISKMVLNGVTMDQFGSQFTMQEQPLHPAVCNRQSEIQYLRSVAEGLIPKLINTQHFKSEVFHSLLRELLACWVLLPLLDVIADPNLLNALIITATDAPVKRDYKDASKVAFLDSFASGGGDVAKVVDEDDHSDLLQDQTKLYAFMQFLKREGAVDLLRFHLDVDHLNSELQDPRVITDPAKLSALQQQSEKLLQTYQTALLAKKVMAGDLQMTDELNVAHEQIKEALHGKWKRAFCQTPEYFKLIYGDTSIPEGQKKKRSLEQINSNNPNARPGKRVGGEGGVVDAASAAWDGFSESSSTASGQSQQNATIYSSMTQKLRKERGQNLDQFMSTFMQSIEQSTDVGEDVFQQSNNRDKGHAPPGKNLVFGDLFELRSPPNGKEKLNYHLHPVRGPSKCFIYIVAEILRLPSMLIKFMISLVNISKPTVDSIICSLLQKLLNLGLYEPRLAVLINLLKDQLFGGQDKEAEPTPSDLLERQRLARERLVALNGHLGGVADMLQSPPMNKHLIYSLFDIIVDEMYPDLLLAPRTAED